jgi:hypothetical protein
MEHPKKRLPSMTEHPNTMVLPNTMEPLRRMMKQLHLKMMKMLNLLLGRTNLKVKLPRMRTTTKNRPAA